MRSDFIIRHTRRRTAAYTSSAMSQAQTACIGITHPVGQIGPSKPTELRLPTENKGLIQLL